MFCKNCGKQLIGIPEICPSCGARPLAGNAFCHNCGATVTPITEICMKCGARVARIEAEVSPKSKLTAALLAFFLGGTGAHRFYIGKIPTAVIMLLLLVIGEIVNVNDVEASGIALLFFVPLSIWSLIDLVQIARGKMKDNEGRLITKGNIRLW